jgi:hypothetical protein
MYTTHTSVCSLTILGNKIIPHKGKNTLRLLENRALKRIFGLKRDEVVGG